MDVLYNDKDWLVLNKPTGLSTQAAFPGDMGLLELWTFIKNEALHAFSRLDKDTSGVLVLAHNSVAAARAQTAQRAGTIQKMYVFLSATCSRAETWLQQTSVDGKSALTAFKRVGQAGKFWRYEALITEGRKHQIRRHAKESGVSVLGDTVYGGAVFPRVALHCQKVIFPAIKCPLEAKMPSSLGYLGDFANEPGFLVALERRQGLFEGITDAYRLVHRGEMTSWDGSIDCFGPYVRFWSYAPAESVESLQKQFDPHWKLLSKRYGFKGAVIVSALKDPHNRGLTSTIVEMGEKAPQRFDVSEWGLRYHVSLSSGAHTGLFLDQRDNRKRVRALAKDQRVANLFAYTCSFSAAALAGGASEVVSVDTSGTSLARGKTLMTDNGLDISKAKFYQEDARLWLKREGKRAPASFGLVICDPPTFSTSKTGGAFSVSDAWPELVLGVKKLLIPTGEALFSHNHQAGDDKLYLGSLTAVFEEVLEVKPPLDFPQTKDKASVHHYWCKGIKKLS